VKLPAHAWRTLWAYHAWAGVAISLVLHVMFVAGAVTLFLAPLRIWEEPVQHVRAAPIESPQALLERGLAAIRDLPARPKRLWLGLPGGDGSDDGVPRFQYSDLQTGAWRAGWLPPHGGFVAEREQAATFLYHFHYLWHPALPALEYLAGLLALAFLGTVITGVVIHVKDLRRQLRQFRPESGRRALWSDLHKVLGVMGLPFQLVWSYTGALLALGPVLITALSGPVFGSEQAAGRIAWNEPAGIVRPGTGPAPSLDDTLAIARRVVPGLSPISFGTQDFGTPRGLVRVYGRVDAPGPDRYANVVIAQASGAVVHVDAAATDLASHATRRWLAGIHYGYFGGLAVRVVLALLALAGCATILTGNWIWLVRRKAAGGAAGQRAHVLARLTAGAGAGVFVAVAGLFVASRALPLDWSARSTVEQAMFAALLVGCVGWALAARVPGDVWWQQLGLAGVLLTTVPVWAARVSPAGLLGAGPRIATVVAVDAGLAIAGACLCTLAWALRRAAAIRRARGAAADEPVAARGVRVARARVVPGAPGAPRWTFPVLAIAGTIAVVPRSDGPLLLCISALLWLSVLAALFVLLEPVWPRRAWLVGAALVIALALL